MPRFKKHHKPNNKRLRVNERIRIPVIFLINAEGEKIGNMPTAKALELAKKEDLDLVEVSPNNRPPVCKLMNFGKYLYDLKKKKKDQKKTSSTKHDIKTLKIGFKTEEHDVNMRIQKAKKFLGKQLKVKLMLVFRGREMQHRNLGLEKMQKFADNLSDISEMESPPRFHGNQDSMVLVPIVGKSKAKPRKESKEKEKSEEGNEKEEGPKKD